MTSQEDYYVFYDTETTGLDINFSQIIQVGCVLTDHDFNIIEEVNLNSQVLPWIVPSPDAFLVHKQTNCLDSGLSHYEMMKTLRDKWLAWGKNKNLIFVSYNGHRFDEELVRRQFYWNLFDPYITNTNGNRRLDLMSLFQIIGNFFSDKVKVPLDNDGNVSFGIQEYIDIPEVKYNPDIGMMGFQCTITLTRPGHRIKKKKIRSSKLPAKQRISQKESIDFFSKEFEVSIE